MQIPIANGAGAQAHRESPEGDTDAVVERVVRRLNAIGRKATLDFAMSVGQLVIDHCYGGDLAAWRGRGAKDVSFRKLARHPDLPMSATALYRSVAMYELSRRLGSVSWQHVSTTHLRVVLPLPRARQGALLELTESNRWSVRRLEEEIASLSGAAPAEGETERKAGAGWSRTLRLLGETIERLTDLANDRPAPPSAEHRRAMAELVQRMRQACEALERHLAIAPPAPAIAYDGPRFEAAE